MRFIHRTLPLRLRHAVPLSIFCAALAVATPRATPAQTPASNLTAPSVDAVVVTAVRGETVVLNEGADSGVRVGSIFTISREGVVRAKLRVTSTTAAQSSALIYDVQSDYQVTVGDTARYFTYEEPVAPLPAATPQATPIPDATPPIPESGTTGGETTTTTTTTTATGATPTTGGTNVVAGSSYIDARITAIDGKNVTLNAGLEAGIRSGVNVPVWRTNSVSAILRITTASTYDSRALITWQDDAAQPLAVGDTIRVEGSGPRNVSNGSETVINNGKEVAPIPAAPVRYETGASNAVVPRADRTYEVLAGLAAAGLIQSQPADTFQNDGILRHRTENDVTFTRAEIAGFVREALENAGDKSSTRNRAALNLLVREYGDELAALRVSPEKIAAAQSGKGFSLGYSGQIRASFLNGKDSFSPMPFSEPQGDIRLKSGADLRLNLFGDISKRLSFYSTLDATTKLDSNSNRSNVSLRRAVLSYNASNILRGLTIEVGKNEYWNGTGHYGTLLLSDVAGGLNSLHTQIKRGSFQYDGIYALLGHGPQGGNRALYNRNFQFKIGDQTRIGFSESLLTPNQTFDAIDFASTVAPVPFPLSFLQRIRNKNGAGKGNTNSLYELYAETSVARGARVYGEFLLDDIATSTNNLTRNRLGSLLGIHVFNPNDSTQLGGYFEYTTLGGRTYFPQIYAPDQNTDYNYFQDGDPLGYPVTADLGNYGNKGRGGADSFRFTVYGKPIPRLSLSAGFEFTDRNSEDLVTQRQQVFRFRGAYNLTKSLTLYGRYLKVSQGVGSSISGPQPPGTPAVVQSKQSRFEIGLAQSF